MLSKFIAWCRNRCPKCATSLEGRIGPLGWGGYCMECGDFPWQVARVKRQGKDKCNKCLAAVDAWGYCNPCNTFPHKKWITEEECLFLDDEDFRRTRPEEYEAMERRQRKHTLTYMLQTKNTPRDLLSSCYGEDLVQEVEKELQSSNSNSGFIQGSSSSTNDSI